MKIEIAPFISTRVYKFNAYSSIGYIFDERTRIYYILKDDVAFLWDAILTFKNYENVFSFAKQSLIESYCDDFLSELKLYNFILINKDFNFTNYKFLKNAVKESDTEAFKTLEFCFSKVRRKLKFLDSISIQPSYKCNQYCKHCFNPKDKQDDEISFDIAKRFIDEAYQLGITSVNMTGGECTLSDNFLKIAKYIREKHLSLIILTNGQRLYDEKFFEEFVNLYPDKVRISLYSMNPEVHDYLTSVKGSFDKTIYVIKKLKQRNVNVAITSPIFSKNKNDYKEVLKFANDIGIQCNYSPKFINNPDNNNGYLKVSGQELEDFYYEQMQLGNFKRKDFKINNECICIGKINNLNLEPNLDINICNDFHYVLGNYATTTLKDIVKNPLQIANKVLTSENLNDCFKYEYCKYCEYCPSIAMLESSFMKKAPSLCEDARAYYNALKRLM